MPQPNMSPIMPLPGHDLENKGVSYKALLIALVITLAIALYVIAALFFNLWPFPRHAMAPTSEQPTPSSITISPSVTIDPTADWQTYRNEQYGFEFKYNPKWSLANSNKPLQYDPQKPFILAEAGNTRIGPCEDLGCDPEPGDRDELTKGDTFEGAPPLNPWFRILRVRGNKWASIQVTDVSYVCSSESTCTAYLKAAPLDQKKRVANPDYAVYNDFLTLLDTFKFGGSATQLNTSHWKTYTSKERTFQFKYPPSLHEVAQDQLADSHGYIQLETVKRNNDQDLELQYNTTSEGHQLISKIMKGPVVMYQTAGATPKGDCGGPLIYVPFNKTEALQIKIFSCQNNEQPLLSESNIYKGILETFSF